jgi:NDP-sugar pyrophosphorylase family protein
VKAVLLAAGLGTRLGSLTGSLPKILVPVAGEPLLARQLRYLAANGVTEAAINLHYLADQVEDYLEGVKPPLTVRTYREASIRGTAGAIFPMRDFLTERFLLLYGDVVTDADLAEFHNRAHGTATLAYYVSSDARDKGVIELDQGGQVIRFVEKPADRGSGSGTRCVNAGLYSLDPQIFDFVPEAGDFGYDVWPKALAAGRQIYARRLDGYLLDMGSPEAHRRLETDVREGAIRW